MDIFIRVEGQEIKPSSVPKKLVDGTQEFIRFVFMLSSDWDDLTTFAQFTQNGASYNQYLDENNAVFLPPEIKTGACTVMLYGSGGNTIATTERHTFNVDRNGLVSDAKSTEITLPLYEQLVNQIQAGVGIESVEQTVVSTEDNGLNEITITLANGMSVPFIVKNGSKGSKGDNGITPHIGDNGNWFIGDIDTGKPSGGSGGTQTQKAEKFTVSISQDDDYNYIADKTFDEIKAAYEAGSIIQCGIWGVYSDIVLAEESSYSFHMLSGYEDANTYKFYIMIVTVIISQDDTIVVLASNSFCPDDLSTSNFIFQVGNANGGWTIYPDDGLNTIHIRTERNSGIDLVTDTSKKQITVSNTGVRSIATGSADGTISVNTNGTAEDVVIKGWPSIPTVTASDAGKFLRVSDTGEWAAETIPSASEVSF